MADRGTNFPRSKRMRKLLIIAVAEGGVALALGEKTVVAFNAASAAVMKVTVGERGRPSL